MKSSKGASPGVFLTQREGVCLSMCLETGAWALFCFLLWLPFNERRLPQLVQATLEFFQFSSQKEFIN